MLDVQVLHKLIVIFTNVFVSFLLLGVPYD